MTQHPLTLAILGASGKMGQRLTALISQDPSFLLTDLEQCQVIIDFSHASVTSEHLATAISLQKPLVLGTTGHTQEQREEIARAATVIPIFFSPNFALGVSLCLATVAKIAQELEPSCRISIFETHHVHKKDSPSGTAIQFAQQCKVHEGVAIHSIREGEVVGEHRIVFECNHETIEIKHQAHSRDAFALGALNAARFLCGKPPGIYDQSIYASNFSICSGVGS